MVQTVSPQPPPFLCAKVHLNTIVQKVPHKVFHFFILPIDFFTLLCYNGSGPGVRFSGSLSAPPGAFGVGECLLLEPGSTHFFYAFPPSFQKRFTPSTLRLNYTIKAPKNQEKSLFLVLNNSTLCAYLFR